MLKSAFITLILTLLGCLAAQGHSYADASTGKPLTPAKLAAKLQRYDVVFFGEWHDNSVLHSAQAELVELLYRESPRLILSFEMFERDTQSALDAYLAGKSNEEEFMAASRPWPNYPSDYRPLVDFARQKGLRAIAANVPRRLAGLAARNGEAWQSSLSDEEKTWAALEVNAPEGRYKENFLVTMRDNGMHGDMGAAGLLDNMFLAQCIKDDTMAESIVRYRELYPRHKIIHFNGDFHSREFLGTVERVLSRSPKLKVAVLSPLYASDGLPSADKLIADFFVLVLDVKEPIEPPTEQGGEAR